MSDSHEPHALGRVLGLDRAPEVKTIRRRIGQLAATGKAAGLLASMGALKIQAGRDQDLAAVLYVDGHVRAYQGTRKISISGHRGRCREPNLQVYCWRHEHN
ncbi:putative transposase [Arthrobacter sp. H5]|uniref:putative transposase n=1 Tax=Arthrobacter sp. H5 TaxID=1267973 RepID=UPI0012DDECFE|nr:hypothetical protein [Arthrobacter sp. H5]